MNDKKMSHYNSSHVGVILRILPAFPILRYLALNRKLRSLLSPRAPVSEYY